MFGLRKCLMMAAGLLFTATPAWACDNDDSDGLDIGLVLSGGGAKASTQVGVMQIMDELDIPIHCIAGTSMGAVVGSFYANGYSADDIGGILKDNDWGRLFRGNVPRRDKSFIEKDREETYFSGNIASFTPGDGIKLPGGLANMQGLKTHFRRILYDVPLAMDFDDLIIPYRAVATNLHNGDKTVFKDGDLVESILASMAVPGVFPPREIDGQFYVDGGLSSNLPVQTARDMGADIIIAIDVSNSPAKPDRNLSVAATASQITTIVIWQKVLEERRKLTENDLLIEPNKDIKISTAGYEMSSKGLDEGREIGEGLKEALLAIKAKAAPRRVRSPAYKSQPAPTTLRVVNTTPVKDELIKSRFDWESHLLDANKSTDNRLRDLASFGGFGEVDIGRAGSEAVLTVSDNPLGRNLLQIGLNATNDFDGESSYSLLARLTRKPLGPYGGDISISGEFGTNHGLSAELYQPLGTKGRYFIQPELFATWREVQLNFFGSRFPDLWQRRLGARTRMGRELGTWGLVAIEGELAFVNTRYLIDSEPLGDPNINTANVGLFFAVDTLNRNDWPTRGQKLRTSAKRIFQWDELGDTEFEQYEASWLGAYRVFGLGTLANARYGNSPTRNGFGSGSFSLGGFRQLSSFSNNSIFADEYRYVSLEVFDRITGRGKLLDLPVYVGGLVEYATFPLTFFEGEADVDAYAGTVYLGIDTPLGPAFIGGSYGNNDAASLFFKFGRTF